MSYAFNHQDKILQKIKSYQSLKKSCHKWKVVNYNDIIEKKMEVIEKIHEDFAIEKDHDIEIVEKIARFY